MFFFLVVLFKLAHKEEEKPQYFQWVSLERKINASYLSEVNRKVLMLNNRCPLHTLDLAFLINAKLTLSFVQRKYKSTCSCTALYGFFRVPRDSLIFSATNHCPGAKKNTCGNETQILKSQALNGVLAKNAELLQLIYQEALETEGATVSQEGITNQPGGAIGRGFISGIY